MKFWYGVITDKVRESRDFYVKLFGCEIVFEQDWFALLRLGESELGFLAPERADQPPIFRRPFHGNGVWIAVESANVDADYARIKAMNVPIEVPLRDEPWGDRHFALVDPNGIAVDVLQQRSA